MRSNNFYVRLFATLLLVALILFAPWYISAAYSIILVFYFNQYFELVFAGLMFDSLFSAPIEKFYQFPFVATMFAIAILIISMFLKKSLIFYNR